MHIEMLPNVSIFENDTNDYDKESMKGVRRPMVYSNKKGSNVILNTLRQQLGFLCQ